MCAWLIALVLVPGVALAAPDPSLAPAWASYRLAAESGEPGRIVEAAREVASAARQSPVHQAPELSFVMLRHADALRTRGERDAAVELAELAATLSPESAAAHVWLAQVFLSDPEPNVLASLGEWMAAGKASLADFWSVLYRIDRVFAAALLSLATAVALIMAYFSLRTIPLFGHLLVEWSGHRLFRPAAWLLAGWIVALPFAAVRWGIWLTLVPGVVLWWFLSRQERLVLWILALVGIAASVTVPHAVPLLTADQSAEFRLVVDVAAGQDASAALAESSTVDSAPGAWARATALVRAGRAEEAVTMFEEALIRWPDDPGLLAGYGNLLFHRGHYDQAIAVYERALAANPTSVAVLFNLSQAYRANLQFEEGEARFQTARTLDAGLLDRYAERARRGDAAAVVDYPAPFRSLLAQAREPRPLSPTLQRAVDEVSRHFALWPTIGVALLFAGCSVAARWVPNQAAAPCVVCGTAVCRHCQRYFLDLKLCPACWKAYAKGIKLHSNAALPQAMQRWKIRRRVAAVWSVVPGAGHLALGRPFWGLGVAVGGSWLIWLGLLREASWNTLDERLIPLPWYAIWAPIALGLTLLFAVGLRHLLTMPWPAAGSPTTQEAPPKRHAA